MSPLTPLRKIAAAPAIVPSLAVLTAAILAAAWLAPSDRVLGDLVKLVYVHGAVIQVALATFAASGLCGAFYAFTARSPFDRWSLGLARAGLVLWVVYVLTSALSMTLAWGGIAWFEPRWIFGLQILLIAPLLQLAGVWMGNRRWAAGLNTAAALVILLLLAQATIVLHPPDPVGESSSTGIKLAYDMLVGLWGLTAIQLARGACRVPGLMRPSETL